MEADELSEILNRAKRNDREALSQLYTMTHDMAYFTALGILKNEQDALDAVQDSYITAFSKLDKLESNSAFPGWLKVIVANTCRDMLKRKSPELFASEDEECDILDNIPEQQENFLPQDYKIILIRPSSGSRLWISSTAYPMSRGQRFFFTTMMICS